MSLVTVDNSNIYVKIHHDVMKLSSQNWPVQSVHTDIPTLNFSFIRNLKFMYVALINTSMKTNGGGCFYLLLARSRKAHIYVVYPGYPYYLCCSYKEEATGSSSVTFFLFWCQPGFFPCARNCFLHLTAKKAVSCFFFFPSQTCLFLCVYFPILLFLFF